MCYGVHTGVTRTKGTPNAIAGVGPMPVWIVGAVALTYLMTTTRHFMPDRGRRVAPEDFSPRYDLLVIETRMLRRRSRGARLVLKLRSNLQRTATSRRSAQSSIPEVPHRPLKSGFERKDPP